MLNFQAFSNQYTKTKKRDSKTLLHSKHSGSEEAWRYAWTPSFSASMRILRASSSSALAILFSVSRSIDLLVVRDGAFIWQRTIGSNYSSAIFETDLLGFGSRRRTLESVENRRSSCADSSSFVPSSSSLFFFLFFFFCDWWSKERFGGKE
jgi:hypothetical protein